MKSCHILAISLRCTRAAAFLLAVLHFLLVVPPGVAQDPPDGKMHVTRSAPNTYTLSVATGSLWEYRIEATDDLAGTWMALDSVFLLGDGDVHSLRVVVPQGVRKSFFRYFIQPRAGGGSGNTLQDWDRVYVFDPQVTINTGLDSDGDGFPDYLEWAFNTNNYDSLSFPWRVDRVDPFNDQAGHPRDGAIVVHLNQPLPASVTAVQADFVRRLYHTPEDILDFASVAPGSAMILPGRKVIAFLPSPPLAAGPNASPVNNYKIDFTTGTTGIEKLVPWHSEFSTVDFFDLAGPWVTLVRPGETAFEVATDFTPVIDWSQPLLPSTVSGANVTVIEQAGGTPVSVMAWFDYETNRMTLSHAAFLPDTTYTVTLGTGFQNLMGKPLLNPFVWSFHTRPLRPVPVLGQGPYVVSITPADFSTNVSLTTAGQLTLTFSEAIAGGSFSAAHVHLRRYGTTDDLPRTFQYVAATRTLTITLITELVAGSRYELTLSAGIRAAATPLLPLQGQALFVFTTAPNPSAGGGGGDPGSGSAGSRDPEQPTPLILALNYGDPEIEVGGGSGPDSGATLSLSITLPDGSQREQQMPNVTNNYLTYPSAEIPAGSTVIVTPKFLKGNDTNYEEELMEVQAEVSGLQVPEEMNYLVFRQEDPPAFAPPTAPAADAWDFLGPLAAGPFIAQVQNNGKLAAVPSAIVPDDNMIGVIGDVIPSAVTGSKIKHFVSPKKSTYLNQDYVELKVSMAAAQFGEFYEWEGGVAGSAANKRKVSRADTGTGPTEVKLKSKKDGTVVSQMDVWVVWSTCTPTPGPTALLDTTAGGKVYKTVNNNQPWTFVFEIQPSKIVTGIASGDDVPDLKGSASTKPPGTKVPYFANPPGDNSSGDTANFKWDVSRDVSVTIRNPSGVSKNALTQAVNIPPLWVGQPDTDGLAVGPTEPIMFPADDAAGNDDPDILDESDDPYNMSQELGLAHAIGQLSSLDPPAFNVAGSWLRADGQTFAQEADFLEFARLELINNPTTVRAGRTWFRISDFVPWHHAIRVKCGSTPSLGLFWYDNSSTSGSDNLNH